MRDSPPCLKRRYNALDELIKELNNQGPEVPENEDEPGVKLMCQFWDILKQEPDFNLPQAVGDRLGTYSGRIVNSQCMTCFTSGKHNCDSNEKKETQQNKNRETLNKIKSLCNRSSEEDKKSCCSHSYVSDGSCSRQQSTVENKTSTFSYSGTLSSAPVSGNVPLSKVLCNLKEAASFDKKCNDRIHDLLNTQKELKNQIQILEEREKDGVFLLKEADAMWATMEEAYKKKLSQSMERQKFLLKELQEIEASTKKWRKEKKDLQFQMTNVAKVHEDIKDKINQKTNDAKYMEMESEGFKKKIEANKKNIEIGKIMVTSRKKESDLKMAKIATEMKQLEDLLSNENKHKYAKEEEGNKYIKEARDDLRKLCRVLLQKKLENEDLGAEKDALRLEINLLKRTCEECKDKCQNKQQSLDEEIKNVETDIAEFKIQCIKCHQCLDTTDVRKFCSDCPRCQLEIDCMYNDDHCCIDTSMDCVCMSIKQKFLENVFENMYTVLERRIKTNPGKAISEEVLKCLRKSRNGKLNENTRKILQDFILTTVKKNLNLTIVGGAVKTRCEMDTDTYKELMLCLKDVQSVRITPKVDKGSIAKKDPCHRWGGTTECNCPKGPKDCICIKKAPPPPKDPTPCEILPEDEEDAATMGAVTACPHVESTSCGPDCAMHAVPSRVGTDVAEWKPDPCREKTCFSKNMRAAQCVLGPEPLSSIQKVHKILPYMPNVPSLDNVITCECGNLPIKPCQCRKDNRSGPRNKIIEEVMGQYTEVSSIQEARSVNEYSRSVNIQQSKDDGCYSGNLPVSYFLVPIHPHKKGVQMCAKTLKTKIVRKCNNGTCTKLWEQVVNDNQSDDIELYIQGVESKYVDNKPVTNIDKEILSKVQKDLTTRLNLQNILTEDENATQYNANTQTKINPYKNDGQIKIVIDNESIVITEFSKTPSGTLVMELDRKIVELIERKTANSSNLSVTLNKSESGKYIVNFNPNKNDSGEIKSILIKTLPSGSSSLEIHTIFSKTFKSSHEKKNNEDLKFKLDKLNQDEKKEADDFSDKYGSEMCTCSEIVLDLNKYILLKKDFRPPKDVDKGDNKISVICSGSETVIDTNNYILSPNDCKISKKVNKDVSEMCSYSEIILDTKKFMLLKNNFEKFKNVNEASQQLAEICSCSKTGINPNKCTLFKSDFKNLLKVNKDDKDVSEIGTCNEIILDINKYILLKKDIKNTKEVDTHSKKLSEKCSYSKTATDINNHILFESDFKNSTEVGKNGKEVFEAYTWSEIILDKNKYILIKKDFNQSKEIAKDRKKLSKICSCSETALDINKKYGCTKVISEVYSCSDISLDKNKYNLVKEDFNKSKRVDKYDKEILEICSCNEIASDVINYILFKKDFKNTKELNENGKEKSKFYHNNKNVGNFINETYVSLSKDFKESEECLPLSHLKKIFDQREKKINFRVSGQNGLSEDVLVTLTRTVSGNNAIDLNNMLALGEFTFKSNEHPILLTQSDSGTCTLDITPTSINTPNAVVRRTLYGGFLAVLKDPAVNSDFSRNNIDLNIPNEEVFMVKVKGLLNTESPSIILKATPSHNYILVIDKEFEKQYTQAIKDSDASGIQYYLDLIKTDSGNYVIDVEGNNDITAHQNKAVIVRYINGQLKILMNDLTPKDNTKQYISKPFGELLSKFIPCSKECQREKEKTSRNLELKYSSAIHEKDKIDIHDKFNVLSKPSVLLKNMKSGQCAAVINKESKKTLINNIKKYLRRNSHRLVPTKQTDTGEITIVFEEKHDEIGRHGFLKITQSGNIYLIANEEFMKGMTKSDELAVSDKSNATTCNAHPELDDHFCDASKCVCHELQQQGIWQFDSPQNEGNVKQLNQVKNKRITFVCQTCGSNQCAENSYIKPIPDIRKSLKYQTETTPGKAKVGHQNYCEYSPKEKIQKRMKFSDPYDKFCKPDILCTRICSTKNTNRRDRSPQSRRPCRIDKNPKSFKQNNHFGEYVCPLQEDQHGPVFNELFQIRGVSNKAHDKSYNSMVDCVSKCNKNNRNSSESSWDSLNFLPPQLPQFLQNVNYRKLE